MNDYVAFRKMITPVIIQVLFWIVVAVAVIVGLATLGQNALGGLAIIIFGPLVARVYAEILIVIFEINGALQDIRAATAGGGGMTRSAPAPVAPSPVP